MQMQDYVRKVDSLSSEDTLFQIPLRKEYLLKQIGHGRRVLDVGCLGGKISHLIREQNNEVWGVEINEAAARAAEKRQIRIKVANVEDGLPFEDDFFDFIHAGEILEHLYDTKHFFEECWRVLRPQGVFIFTTPNLNSLENRVRILSGRYLAMAGAYPEDHFGEHVRIFNFEKVHELCWQAGFSVEEIRGIPILQPKGRMVDFSFSLMGRVFPKWSKLLMVKARKEMED